MIELLYVCVCFVFTVEFIIYIIYFINIYDLIPRKEIVIQWFKAF